MLKIFIGYDSRFPEPTHVAEYSIRKHATSPLDITFLQLANLDFSYKVDEQCSTEFTYTRFLIPYLCNYKGFALFLDNDILVLNNIKDLLNLSMEKYALRVVKHKYIPSTETKMYGTNQVPYARKNWSSVMLMNCALLKKWTKEYVENTPGIQQHQFKAIPDELIGDLPIEWNSLDYMNELTKLIHYTSGGPWFEKYKDCAFAELWNLYRAEWRTYN